MSHQLFFNAYDSHLILSNIFVKFLILISNILSHAKKNSNAHIFFMR
jgi:hypothetical protein